MGDDFDRVRERTGIDKLDSSQRKKLFREFVEHGGELVDEERSKQVQKPKKAPIKRPSTTGKETGTASIPEMAGRREPARTAVRRTETARAKKHKKKKSLKIYLHGVLLRVFSLSGNRFSERFLDAFRDQVKNHLLNLHLLVNSFLKGSSSIKKEIMNLSTGENSLFYEVLYRMCILYDENEYEIISKSFSNKTIPGGPHVEIFKQFFKKLYILGQYTDLCKFFIQKAVDLQMQTKKVEKHLAAQMKPKLKVAVNSVFIDYLPRLHIILCKMVGAHYPLYSQQLDDYLCFTDQDRIGYITRIEKKKRIEELRRMKEYLKQKQSETHEEEEEKVKVPRHVERGFRFIDEAIERFEKIYLPEEEKNLYRFMDKNDKLYRTAILLESFDREYSFILTTGKISFNIDYLEQRKIDAKEDMNHAYLILSEARHEVKDYLDTIGEIYKTERDIRLTNYQKSEMLSSLQKKRSFLSKSSRNKVAEVMDSIHSILSTVINDYNGPRRLLQNPDDQLDFTENLGTAKKLHGRKIIEAMVEAFLFASAFHFLLTYGELAGSGLTIESQHPEQESDSPQEQT
jgi:hypothetical protein